MFSYNKLIKKMFIVSYQSFIVTFKKHISCLSEINLDSVLRKNQNCFTTSEITNVTCLMQGSQVKDVGIDPVSLRLLGKRLVRKLSMVYSTYDAPFCKKHS